MLGECNCRNPRRRSIVAKAKTLYARLYRWDGGDPYSADPVIHFVIHDAAGFFDNCLRDTEVGRIDPRSGVPGFMIEVTSLITGFPADPWEQPIYEREIHLSRLQVPQGWNPFMMIKEGSRRMIIEMWDTYLTTMLPKFFGINTGAPESSV